MLSSLRLRLRCSFWLLAIFAAGQLHAGENLLRNPGFEDPLAPVWEKRTPDDASRKLYRAEGEGRSGEWAVALDNLEPAYTRLRQGHDRSIQIEPGCPVELSAWVRSELSDTGRTMLQIYCIGDDDRIRAQPTSPQIRGSCDWTRSRVHVVVPEGTVYVMAYLQTRDGAGRVFFDDLELAVKREPRPRKPVPKVGLLTDLAEDDPCVESLKVLFAEGLVCLDAKAAGRGLDECDAALLLFGSETVPEDALDQIERFAKGGGPVFMDVRNFAQWQSTPASLVSVKRDDADSLESRMASGLQVVKASAATAGFTEGQVMPRASHPSGQLMVLPKEFSLPGLEVLAVSPGGEPGLVRLALGKGFVVAADVLSLREPFYSNVDGYYKYAPITNALTNPVRFGEYYPSKMTYAELVEYAQRLAAEFPAIRFEWEGPASEDYRLYSLNLGRNDRPMYFMYAAAHGSEWEPGYGLITFAKRIAEGKLNDVIDLDKAAIKIVPHLNPWGYDHRQRQNAQGVDLNRQGDYAWEGFQGRDSTEDGTWGPGDYDWKSTAPFCEPEAQTYKAIVDKAQNLYCVLDFHGNTSATSNKIAILPATADPDNQLAAWDLQYLANERLRGRHLLRQNAEETFSQYLLDRVSTSGSTPFLMNTSARDRFGLLIELTAGYGETYGTVLQTDVTCELCRALFVAYPPPKVVE